MREIVEAPIRERHISKKRVLVGGKLGFSEDEKYALVREVVGLYGSDKDRTGLTNGFRPVLKSGEEGWEVDRTGETVGIIDFLHIQPRLVLESYGQRARLLRGSYPITTHSSVPHTLNLEEVAQVREEHLTATLEEAFLMGRKDMIDRILNDNQSLSVRWADRVERGLAS